MNRLLGNDLHAYSIVDRPLEHFCIVMMCRSSCSALHIAALCQGYRYQNGSWNKIRGQPHPKNYRPINGCYFITVSSCPDVSSSASRTPPRLKLPKTEVALFFEIDRSTEGHKQIIESSRLDAYVELFNRRLYRRYWTDLETKYHYVMWVCRSKQRIDNLKTTLGKHPITNASRFCVFSHFTEGRDVVTSSVWQTSSGQFRSIFAKSDC